MSRPIIRLTRFGTSFANEVFIISIDESGDAQIRRERSPVVQEDSVIQMDGGSFLVEAVDQKRPG